MVIPYKKVNCIKKNENLSEPIQIYLTKKQRAVKIKQQSSTTFEWNFIIVIQKCHNVHNFFYFAFCFSKKSINTFFKIKNTKNIETAFSLFDKGVPSYTVIFILLRLYVYAALLYFQFLLSLFYNLFEV